VSRVAALSRAEAGCEGYLMCEDIETPNAFIFVERWRSLDALRGHFQTPHFGDLFGALPKMAAEPPDVQIHDVSSAVAFDELLTAAGVGG
jgi:quinol monooxygenase YgiN